MERIQYDELHRLQIEAEVDRREFANAVRAAILPLVKQWYLQTGRAIRSLRVETLDVSTLSNSEPRFALGDVHVEDVGPEGRE